MGECLIFCFECNEESGSDKRYIKHVCDKYYGRVVYFPVFLGGKGNYNKPKIIKEIRKKIGILKEQNTEKLSVKVIYFIDTDRQAEKHIRVNNDIREFCEQNDYEVVWFVHKIEQVMHVSGFDIENVKPQKKVDASKAYRIENMEMVVTENLEKEDPLNKGESNILKILDKYLKRITK